MVTLTPQEFDKLPHGCDCAMIKRDGFGFKLYRTKDKRNRAFLNQTSLAAHGLSPKCWQPFEMELNIDTTDNYYDRWRHVYGYVTELVYVLDTETYHVCEADTVEFACPSGDMLYKDHAYVKTCQIEMKELQDRAGEICGASWWDTNFFNAGVTDDGRLVIIDTAEYDMFTCVVE